MKESKQSVCESKQRECVWAWESEKERETRRWIKRDRGRDRGSERKRRCSCVGCPATNQCPNCWGCSWRHDGKMASVSESCSNAVHVTSSASQDKVGQFPMFFQVLDPSWIHLTHLISCEVQSRSFRLPVLWSPFLLLYQMFCAENVCFLNCVHRLWLLYLRRILSSAFLLIFSDNVLKFS